MRFKILGPLEVGADDGQLTQVSRRLHRTALAYLLLNAGQPCASSELVGVLWGDDPPLSPDVSLRSCIYGIRKLLPDAHRLRTHPAGYLITVAPGELDLHDFRDLHRQGREALDSGDPGAAAALLARALGLWREPPLADLPAAAAKERLLDQRREASDALTDALLSLGRHRQVLAELRSAVTADPLREHAWAQLMIALYRCGARAEALAAFGKIRMTLISAYGIEPGPELQDLHRQILTDDPALMLRSQARRSLANSSAAGEPAPADWPSQGRPACQLPASVADFTGRATELADLLARLPGDGMAVTVITGMLGVGKTELAVHAAHLVRSRFPDGQLYACLDDAGQARDPQVVLGELMRGLGVAAEAIPAPGFEREAMYRSVLAGRQVLVVADGATGAAQVRPLLPGTTGCAVVVTSRARLTGLEGARLIELDPLLPAESVSALTRICGRELCEGDAAAIADIASACGHLPLALRVAGARLADDPDLTVGRLAALLADESRRLDELALGELSVRARFDAAAMSFGDPARHALALLATAGPRDLPGGVIASLLADPSAVTAAPALADAGLLKRVTGAGASVGTSYRMHPLVRAYARELLADCGPGAAGSATGRLLASGWLELANRGTASRIPMSLRIATLVGERRLSVRNPARS